MATEFAFVDDSGLTRFEGFLVPNPGGGVAPSDVGLITAVSLLDGPADFFTPSAGQYVAASFDLAGYVAWDGDLDMIVGRADEFPLGLTLKIEAGLSPHQVQLAFCTNVCGWVQNRTTPIGVYLRGAGTGAWIGATLPAWQANHGYADVASPVGPLDATNGITMVSHVWSSTVGTSGGSTPDFAGNIGGTVTDNDITWTDEGAIPTTGQLHFYALASG